MGIKVTVCELHNEPAAFASDWKQLVSHVNGEASHLVVLPEMPFSPWFATTSRFDLPTWQAAVTSHDRWEERLQELSAALVLSSRPINRGKLRLNEGFLWESQQGYRPIHQKYYLPNEEAYWEASWYQRGNGDFVPITQGEVQLGMLICSDLWSLEHARSYGHAGVHLIAVPRATEQATTDKWIVGGRAAAILSGAFCLSSNRANGAGEPGDFGGRGWMIGPEGDILGLTSQQHSFVTVEIDLQKAEQAKKTYPRYMFAEQ